MDLLLNKETLDPLLHRIRKHKMYRGIGSFVSLNLSEIDLTHSAYRIVPKRGRQVGDPQLPRNHGLICPDLEVRGLHSRSGNQ